MKNEPSPTLEALRQATATEALAVEFMEEQRFGDCPACPRCGGLNVYKMMAAAGARNADYRWRCRGCVKMFTVRTGTVLEKSRLPLRVWVFAFWRACASKKGIGALQLSREMQITHRSALFVLRRIRFAMGVPTRAPKVGGEGERQEKEAVGGLAERGGDVRFFTLARRQQSAPDSIRRLPTFSTSSSDSLFRRGYGAKHLSFYRSPKGKKEFLISGVSRDSAGAILGSCIVDLYRVFDPTGASEPPAQWYRRTTSDASTGAYSFSVPSNGWTFQVISYKAGGTDVAGVTKNTLVGV